MVDGRLLHRFLVSLDWIGVFLVFSRGLLMNHSTCREGAHVHFQLCTEPPETHDMPGAVSLEDRKSALLLYPDPRCVLGMLY